MCLINNITVMVAWTVDEAGLYLSTFKQYEHKSPDLIKERVDKDYNSVLRTSLTSISRVNKTDVETLKTSLGSFADIAKTPADRLQNLPGFGQVKVKKIKDAFEKPFRNNATSSLPSQSRSIFDAGLSAAVVDPTSKGRGKEKAAESSTTPPDSRRPPREPSPVWDLELDLDLDADAGIDSHNSPQSGPPPVPRTPATPANIHLRDESSSPVWDIELDLNVSDDDNDVHGKGFGAAALL